ncbi:MAG: hypothetical protein JKP92_05880 [Alphaproteobacteria bacterium]|jgi:hypothetical protein|nr:hypothetical protein [Alphaproteobacteria bacterium]
MSKRSRKDTQEAIQQWAQAVERERPGKGRAFVQTATEAVERAKSIESNPYLYVLLRNVAAQVTGLPAPTFARDKVLSPNGGRADTEPRTRKINSAPKKPDRDSGQPKGADPLRFDEADKRAIVNSMIPWLQRNAPRVYGDTAMCRTFAQAVGGLLNDRRDLGRSDSLDVLFGLALESCGGQAGASCDTRPS